MSNAQDGHACPHLASCPMFPLFNVQGALEIWKLSYCLSTYARCERYIRSTKGESVPDSLMPSGVLLKLTKKPGAR